MEEPIDGLLSLNEALTRFAAFEPKKAELETGQVIHKAEKSSCRSCPEATGDGIQNGPKRNYQILSPLDFLAEFTQHIAPQGSHLIRYYGWYSNKSRGIRKKAKAQGSAESSSEDAS